MPAQQKGANRHPRSAALQHQNFRCQTCAVVHGKATETKLFSRFHFAPSRSIMRDQPEMAAIMLFRLRTLWGILCKAAQIYPFSGASRWILGCFFTRHLRKIGRSTPIYRNSSTSPKNTDGTHVKSFLDARDEVSARATGHIGSASSICLTPTVLDVCLRASPLHFRENETPVPEHHATRRRARSVAENVPPALAELRRRASCKPGMEVDVETWGFDGGWLASLWCGYRNGAFFNHRARADTKDAALERVAARALKQWFPSKRPQGFRQRLHGDDAMHNLFR